MALCLEIGRKNQNREGEFVQYFFKIIRKMADLYTVPKKL